jgi:hypothetical protein
MSFPEAFELPAELTTQQIMQSLHRNLWANQIPNELVADSEHRPLAVHIPNVLDPDIVKRLAGRVLAVRAHLDGGAYKYDHVSTPYSQPEVAGRLAVGQHSGEYFTEKMEEIADITVQAALNTPQVRATSLSLNDGGHLMHDIPFHVDKIKNTLRVRKVPEPNLGINMNLMLTSSCQVDLGYVTIEDLQKIATYAERKTTETTSTPELDEELNDLYISHCKSFGQVIVKAGGLLVHRGAARSTVGLPTAHKFTTLDGVRASGIMLPSFNDETTVLAGRSEARVLLAK